jgi:hypothetical protein
MLLKDKPLIKGFFKQIVPAHAMAEQVQENFDHMKAQAEIKAQAETSYIQGLELIKAAEAKAYSDKSKLLGAYRHLATAQRKNGKEPRYACGMAYLMLLIGNHGRAQRYVAQALVLAPQNEQALTLQASLRQLLKLSPEEERQARWNAFEQLPLPSCNNDYDWYYEHVEQFLKKEVQILMQLVVSPQVTLNTVQMEHQAELYTQLTALEASVGAKFRIIERSFDTLTLNNMMLPLKQMQERYRLALEQHAHFQILIDGLNGGMELALELLEHLGTAGEKEIQDRLNQLYDLCDEIADDLDDLSDRQGLDIKPVKQIYSALIRLIESIQEKVDEQ